MPSFPSPSSLSGPKWDAGGVGGLLGWGLSG